MNATIIYPQQTTFQIEIPEEYIGAWKDSEILNYIFEATNPASGNETLTNLNKQGAKLRSSMVGDIFVVNGKSFMVDTVGFKELTPIESIKIQQISARWFGYDYIKPMLEDKA